ncbi:hypothetical protein [Actinomadura hibisca]|uniref:hypothetical protein n=1 Tax=Actinomadura hibisca TaxID=68565 RepID=UPI00082A8F88|nr:hypothetical protein [Actinomadura hibisca]
MRTTVKNTRVRPLVLGVLALIVTGVTAGIVYLALTFTGGKELRYETQPQLRNALAGTAGAELKARGVPLREGLTCTDMAGWSKAKTRASCTGRTADRKPVQVFGSGEDRTRDHYYTILVDGKPLVQNVRCLADDCRRAD